MSDFLNLNAVLREVDVLKTSDSHPNVIRYYCMVVSFRFYCFGYRTCESLHFLLLYRNPTANSVTLPSSCVGRRCRILSTKLTFDKSAHCRRKQYWCRHRAGFNSSIQSTLFIGMSSRRMCCCRGRAPPMKCVRKSPILAYVNRCRLVEEALVGGRALPALTDGSLPNYFSATRKWSVLFYSNVHYYCNIYLYYRLEPSIYSLLAVLFITHLH